MSRRSRHRRGRVCAMDPQRANIVHRSEKRQSPAVSTTIALRGHRAIARGAQDYTMPIHKSFLFMVCEGGRHPQLEKCMEHLHASVIKPTAPEIARELKLRIPPLTPILSLSFSPSLPSRSHATDESRGSCRVPDGQQLSVL